MSETNKVSGLPASTNKEISEALLMNSAIDQARIALDSAATIGEETRSEILTAMTEGDNLFTALDGVELNPEEREKVLEAMNNIKKAHEEEAYEEEALRQQSTRA